MKSAYSKKERVQLVNDEASLTKQSFQNECNINSIMKKWEKTGLLSHSRSSQPRYGDFSNVTDYQSALNAVSDAQEAFMELPAQVRARFANDPAELLTFIQDPANLEEMYSLGLVERKALDAVTTAVSESSDQGNEVSQV